VATQLATAVALAPALHSALDSEAIDPRLAAFGEAAAEGLPYPPAAALVADLWRNAWADIYAGHQPSTTFEAAAEQIRQRLAEHEE
jgi:hypothetical protein